MENKHDVFGGKDCRRKFCKSLIEHAMKTINFLKKIKNLLTKEQQELYENAKICYNCRKKLKINI